MRAVLAITVKELKLLSKDPGSLLLLFALPAIFILVLSTALQGAFSSPDSADKIDVLLVNNDAGGFGADLAAFIDENGHFRSVTRLDGEVLTRARCRAEVSAGRYHIAIVVPEEMNRGLSLDEKRTIELLVDPTFSKEVALAIEGAIKELAHLSMLAGKIIEAEKKGVAIDTLSDRIDAIKALCDTCRSDFDRLIKRLKRGLPPKPPRKEVPDAGVNDSTEVDVAVGTIDKQDIENTVNVIEGSGVEIVRTYAFARNVARNDAPNSVQQNVPGWTIFALFWIAQILMINILYERESGAFKRVMVAPVSFPVYILAKTIPFVVINLLQAVVMFAFGVYVLPCFDLPELALTNLPALAVLTLAISFTAIGFGLMMASLSRAIFLAAAVSATVLIIMTALGGIMVPRFVMPEAMQRLSLFVPHGWALEGYLNVIVRQQTTAEILPQAGALLLFGAAFFVFAIVRMHRLNRQ